MRPKIGRRFAAVAIALLVVSSLPSCSKPIDPNSSIPATYQPLVFLLAAVGIGIGLTALHHHGENHSNGPVNPGLRTPSFVGAVGNQPFDLAIDTSVAGSVGVLGKNGGGGSYGFAETGSSSTNSGSYRLPVGYHPVAVGIDGIGDDWFVDSAGNVEKCPPPTSTVTTCAPLLTLSDGLGSGGVRALVADSTHVFIADDNRAGSVNWAAFALDGSGRLSGSYIYTGAGIYSQDAAATVAGAEAATYIVFHQNGNSWIVPLPGPAAKNSFSFSPQPLAAANVAFDGSTLFFGTLGSTTSGSYQIGRWAGANNGVGQTPGSLVSVITIAFNGQTSPNGPPFAVPVKALRTDGAFIYMLDSSGNLVLFGVF